MSETCSIRFHSVVSGHAVCDVRAGGQSIGLVLAEASTVPGDLLWAALTGLHARRNWWFGVDDEPGLLLWFFDNLSSVSGEIGLQIFQVDEETSDEWRRLLAPTASADLGKALLQTRVNGVEFARAVLGEINRWRDEIGVAGFEQAFNTAFPNRLLAALEAALSTRPFSPLHLRIDHSEFLPADGKS